MPPAPPEWTIFDSFVNVGGLLIWIFFGAFALYAHNSLLSYLYLAYAVGMSFTNLYFGCTRCYYYRKGCYLLGGQLSALIFPGRRLGPQDPDDAIVNATWIILSLAPIIFLLYFQDWGMAAAFAALTFIWHLQHQYTACRKCRNDWCPYNPAKK